MLQGPQALQHEAAAPVHRTGREARGPLVEIDLEPPGQLGVVALVVAPELGAEHAAVGGDDAEGGCRPEGGQDLDDVVRLPEQLGSRTARQVSPSPASSACSARHALCLVCTLRTSRYGSRRPVLTGGDGRPDVPAVVGDLEHPVVAGCPVAVIVTAGPTSW